MPRLLAAAVVLMMLAGCGRDEEPKAAPSTFYDKVKAWSCDDVGQEAIRISQTNGRGAKLLAVRDMTPLQDNRVPGMGLPSGRTDQTVLLHCEAKATWSDTTRSPVDLRWTVDAHGKQFVYYRSIDQ